MRSWLVEDWYGYGGLNLIGGQVGAGKTGLEIGLMAAALAGRSWMGRKTTRPARWVQIVTDRSLDTRQYWAEQYGVELPGPDATYVTDDENDHPLLEGAVLDRLKSTNLWLAKKLDILKPHPLGVVTIDVATPFFPPAQLDYFSGYWPSKWLRKVLCAHPSCYLLLSHGSKYKRFSSAGRLVDRIIGNTCTIGVMDTTSYISTTVEGKDYGFGEDAQAFAVYPRMAKEEVFRLVRDERGRLLQEMAETETQPSTRRGGPKHKLTLEQFLAFFEEPAGFLLVAEKITSECDASSRTVQRRLQEARERGLLHEVSPGVWVKAS